ncbi:MAG: porphobilinogen synthase [Alphaproteobacteria bacterium]|nr:porphobilinogen synthase [Alphaproteobacteria bacterium]
MDLLQRPRRIRSKSNIRDITRETHLNINDFVLPLFIKEGNNIDIPISSMPGHRQLSIDMLDGQIDEIAKLGIRSIILFGIPAHKDALGSHSLSDNGVIQESIRKIKASLPDLNVIADVCLCEYTNHGHCGVLDNNEIDNDKTLPILAEQALSYARAGADIIAPSGMMDGMVLRIRNALDKGGFRNIPIMSYTNKFASSMYGPFRDAAEGAPKFGDRKTYQMDFSNSDEAMKEAKLDIEQGADILIVKPAHTYLDIIYRVKQTFVGTPIAAYHTSGEFAMVKAAAEKGLLNEEEAIIEIHTAIKRAGANIIISYYTKDIARLLKNN